jgi:hypothetical protein
LAKQARIRGGNVRLKAVFTRRNVLLGLLATILAIVGYYTIVVVDARARTSGLADSYYSSGSVVIQARDLSSRQLEILLKVEDPSFYTHHGVDFTTPGAGWTTITQALAKRFYFDDFQQGLMKVKQTLCAWLALDPLVGGPRRSTLDPSGARGTGAGRPLPRQPASAIAAGRTAPPAISPIRRSRIERALPAAER